MLHTLPLTFGHPLDQKKICIEAAHFYTDKHPDLEQIIGARWGGVLAKYFAQLGYTTQNWLFVDDYNPAFAEGPKKIWAFATKKGYLLDHRYPLDLRYYLLLLDQWGFPPAKVVYESEMLESAKEALAYLLKKRYASSNTSGEVVLSKDNILLFTPEKEEETERFSCSLLDACLYLQKLEHADCCITVLEESFLKQQKKALAILKKLGKDTAPLLQFYYSSSLERTLAKPVLPSPESALSLFTQAYHAGGNFSGEKT